MSNLTLDRPTSPRSTEIRSTETRRPTAPATVGSYVDTDGVRRVPQRAGSYVGQPVASVGSYADRDGVRRVGRVGTYTSAQR